MSDKIKELKKRLTHIISSTNDELSKFEEIKETVVELEKEKTALKKVVDKQKEIKSENRKEIENQGEKLEELENDIKRKNADLVTTKEDIDSFNSRKGLMIKAAEDDAEEIVDAAKKEADKIKSDKEEECKNLSDKIQGKYGELSLLVAELIYTGEEIELSNLQKKAVKEEEEKAIADREAAQDDRDDIKKKVGEANAQLLDINDKLDKAKEDIAEENEKLDSAKGRCTAIVLDIDNVKNDRRTEQKEFNKIKKLRKDEEKKWTEMEERRLAFIEKESGYGQAVKHIREVYAKAKIQCPI